MDKIIEYLESQGIDFTKLKTTKIGSVESNINAPIFDSRDYLGTDVENSVREDLNSPKNSKLSKLVKDGKINIYEAVKPEIVQLLEDGNDNHFANIQIEVTVYEVSLVRLSPQQMNAVKKIAEENDIRFLQEGNNISFYPSEIEEKGKSPEWAQELDVIDSQLSLTSGNSSTKYTPKPPSEKVQGIRDKVQFNLDNGIPFRLVTEMPNGDTHEYEYEGGKTIDRIRGDDEMMDSGEIPLKFSLIDINETSILRTQQKDIRNKEA